MGGFTYNDEYEEVVISSMGSASTELESLKSIASGISIPSDFTYKSALEKIIADISSFDLNETINTMASSMLSFMQSEMTASELANKDGYVTYYELVAQMHQKPKQKSEYTKKEKPKKTKYEEMWDRLNKSTESSRKALNESMEVFYDHKNILDKYALEKGKIGFQEFFWNPVDLIYQKALRNEYHNDPTKAREEAFMNAYLTSHSKKLSEKSNEADEKYKKEMEKFISRNYNFLEENNDYFQYNIDKDLKAGRISEATGKYFPIVVAITAVTGGAGSFAAGAGATATEASTFSFWSGTIFGGLLHGQARGMEAATGYLNSPDHSDANLDDVAKSRDYGMKIAAVTTAADIITAGMGAKAHKVVSAFIEKPVEKIIASGLTQAVTADLGYAANVMGMLYAGSSTDNKNYYVDLLNPDVQKDLIRDLKYIGVLNFFIGAGWSAIDINTTNATADDAKNIDYRASEATNNRIPQEMNHYYSYDGPKNINEALKEYGQVSRDVLGDIGIFAEKVSMLMDKNIYDITYAIESRNNYGIMEYSLLKAFGG